MNKNDQNFLIEKIRTEYTETEHTQLDELRALHKKVKRPANLFGYIFGSLGAIIMGSGMSLVMTDIGNYFHMEDAMIPGIVIGVIGLLITIINYPIYKKILSKRKQKYAERILQLSEEMLKEE